MPNTLRHGEVVLRFGFFRAVGFGVGFAERVGVFKPAFAEILRAGLLRLGTARLPTVIGLRRGLPLPELGVDRLVTSGFPTNFGSVMTYFN